MKSVTEALKEFYSEMEDVDNQSEFSMYDPCFPTSPIHENDCVDREIECNESTGNFHKTSVNSTVEHSSKNKSEMVHSQKDGTSHKKSAKSIIEHSSKSEINEEGKNREERYKFKISKKESKNNLKPVPHVVLSDSETEDQDESNINSEKENSLESKKVENTAQQYDKDIIPRYDHTYIIGRSNPLFQKNKTFLNYTFIEKALSDLDEDNVEYLLEKKGPVVANSVCIFVCDLLDITKKYVDSNSLASKSQGNDLIVYELNVSSSTKSNEEGKVSISKMITSFIKIVNKLKKKLPVVIMPLQPYMLIAQFRFAMNENGADDTKLFVHGTSYKWTHYRDHFVKDWMRILDTNDKNINRFCIESFVTKPLYVYPVRKGELKGIGIERRKLEWSVKVNEAILMLVKAEVKKISAESVDSTKQSSTTSTYANTRPEIHWWSEEYGQAKSEMKKSYREYRRNPNTDTKKIFEDAAARSRATNETTWRQYKRNISSSTNSSASTSSTSKVVHKTSESSTTSTYANTRPGIQWWSEECEQAKFEMKKCYKEYTRNPNRDTMKIFEDAATRSRVINETTRRQYIQNISSSTNSPASTSSTSKVVHKTSESNVPAESSKDKLRSHDKCEIEVANVTESVPLRFFGEMSKKAGKEAICKFEEGYVEITFDSHIKGHLFADYLDDLAIGDTVLKTSLIDRDCKDIPKPRKSMKRKFRDTLQSDLEFWVFTAAELANNNIRQILSCESYKTIECTESDCDESMCILYHNEEDRRRNPYSIPYLSQACKYMSTMGFCRSGEKCGYAHNNFESVFHPFEIYFNLCQDYESRKECFSANPLCPCAHLGTPETFFTKYWKDSLIFGTSLAVEFLAGAIRKFNLYNKIFKDCRIFFMGASGSFLNNVRNAVSQICRIHTLNNDFVGQRDLMFEGEPLLFGTPSKFLESVGHLFLHPFTLIIISQIDVILPNKRERKALINFFARCKMPFAPPFLQILFVADEYNSQLQSMIKHYFNKDVKIIKKPEHKIEFKYNVPFKPLKGKLPKYLQTGANPTQVYPFLSSEVVDAMRHAIKKKIDANTPWFRKDNFFPSDSSEFSDSSDSTSSVGTSTSRRGKKRNSHYHPSSSRHRSRSKSPNRKRRCSRSSSRERSSSRCSPKKPVKKPHSRQSYSPPRTSGLVSYARSSSSSVSPERSPAKKKFRDDEKHIKDKSYRSHPSRKSVQKNRSTSKERFDTRDAKDRDIKRSPSPFPPPPHSSNVAPKNILERKSSEKEQEKTNLTIERIVHRSILVEFATRSFNMTYLKKELGDELFKEFEKEKEKTCFMLEEEFDIYKNMPELYEKYEEFYDGFTKMYLIKYPDHNEEHKETLWKKFWKSKYDSAEKNDLRNRMVSLIEEFKKKIKANPSAPPPPPIISGLTSRSEPCKSEIKMTSERHRPSAVIEQIRSSKNMEASSSSFNFKRPLSNASASTSGLSSKSLNFKPTPPPPPNISSLKHRVNAEHNIVGNPNEKMHIYKKSTPPPIISDRILQPTFNKGYSSNETSDSRFTSVKDPLLSEGIVSKSSFRSGIGSSIDGPKREAPLPEEAHSALAPIHVASLPAHIMALAKGFSSEIRNKNEVSSIIYNLSSSFSTPSVTSRDLQSVDKQSKGNSPLMTSKQTSTHTKVTVSGGESSIESFNMDKAITDLESIVPDIEILGPSIMTIIECSKEEGINSKNSLKTFTDPDNVTLIELALKKMKVKCKQGREEFYLSLERSVRGLLKHAKQELEKKEEEKKKEKDISLNYKAIAQATLGKDTPTIMKMIRTAALYEGIELNKQQQVESYVKVCSMHFDLTINK